MTFANTLRRRWPLLALVAVLAPLAGWSAFWFFARSRALAETDALAQPRAGAPFAIVCAERSVGGFPLNIAVVCRDPVMTVAGDHGPVTLRLPVLTVTTLLYDPHDQTIDAQGPLAASDATGGARAEWTAMRIGVRGIAPMFDSVLLHGEGLRLACDACPDAMRAAGVDAMDVLAQRRGDTNDFTFSATLAGTKSALLTRITASDQPAAVATEGLITEFQFPTSLRFAGEAERWRRDGGRLTLDAASLDQGALHVQVAGAFGLDAVHRPEGSFNLGARNAATLISAFTGGTSPLLQLAIGAILRGIDSSTAKSGDDSGVKLSGTMANGSLSLGPIRGIATIAPLY